MLANTLTIEDEEAVQDELKALQQEAVRLPFFSSLLLTLILESSPTGARAARRTRAPETYTTPFGPRYDARICGPSRRSAFPRLRSALLNLTDVRRMYRRGPTRARTGSSRRMTVANAYHLKLYLHIWNEHIIIV